MGTQIMRDKMISYPNGFHEEIEKYASELEVTCDYYLSEFYLQTNNNSSPTKWQQFVTASLTINVTN